MQAIKDIRRSDGLVLHPSPLTFCYLYSPARNLSNKRFYKWILLDSSPALWIIFDDDAMFASGGASLEVYDGPILADVSSCQ